MRLAEQAAALGIHPLPQMCWFPLKALGQSLSLSPHCTIYSGFLDSFLLYEKAPPGAD